MNFPSILLSAIIQVILLSAIPFIWWYFSSRKEESFFNWIGLKKPIVKNEKQFSQIMLYGFILLFIPYLILPYFVDSSTLATSQFAGKGIAAVIPALIYAFIQTGLSEEIFFRGFITKRLCSKFDFATANIIQALLFGLLHGIMISSFAGWLGIIFATIVAGTAGWVMGLVNEKYAQGSILPGWFIHGGTNLIGSILAMYNII